MPSRSLRVFSAPRRVRTVLTTACLAVLVLCSSALLAGNVRDLAVVGPSLSAGTIPAGGSAVLTYDVTNLGDHVVSKTYREAIYLSADPLLDVGDVEVGRSHGHTYNLPPGGRHGAEVVVLLPSSASVGSSYLLILANSDQNVAEDVSNNLVAFAVTVTPPGESDLAIEKLVLTSTSVASGNKLNATYDVRNYGVATVETTYRERLFLSTDTVLDSSDIAVGRSHGHTADLAGPSGAHATNVAVSVPPDVSPGSYYVLVQADSEQAVPEDNEGNNVAWTSLQVHAGDKDLEAEHLKLSGSNTIDSGARATLSYEIVNRGKDVVMETYKERILLSTDRDVDATDVELGWSHNHTADLEAHDRHASSMILRIPASTVPGNYYLLVVTDALDAVAETREQNNVYSKPIKVRAGTGDPGVDDKDLAIRLLKASQRKVEAGAQVTLTYDVENRGQDTVTTSYRELIYLSTSSSHAGALLLAGSHSHTKDLHPLAPTHASSSQVTIPTATTAGQYYLIVVADAEGRVEETDETNNAEWVKVTVEPPGAGGTPATERADLVVVDLQLTKKNVRVGDVVTAEYTVANVGNEIVAQSYVDRLFLSSDNVLDSGDELVGISHYHTADLPGASGLHPAATPFAVPGSLPPGKYFVLVQADALKSVDEADETNNITYALLDVRSRSDSSVFDPSDSDDD